MNNASMGIRFYPTKKCGAKGKDDRDKEDEGDQGQQVTSTSSGTAVGGASSPLSSIGGGVSAGGASLGMRGGYNADETFFMAKRAKAAASKPPEYRAPLYQTTGYVAGQRIPEGNVLDTTYMMRVGGVLSHQVLDPPTTRINSDAMRVWGEQLRSSRSFSMDRESEWTGRPQNSI